MRALAPEVRPAVPAGSTPASGWAPAAQPQAPPPLLPTELPQPAAAIVHAVLTVAILLAVWIRARSLEPVELGEENPAILEALRKAGA